jgi:hypothetical protein
MKIMDESRLYVTSASQKYGSNKLAQFGFALLAAFPDSYRPDSYRQLVGEGGFGGGWCRPQAPLAFKQPHIFVKHSYVTIQA